MWRTLSSFVKQLPLIIIALLAAVAVVVWSGVEPALLNESYEIQLRFVELYVQVIGILLGFYGVIITQHQRPSSSQWLWVPVPLFLIYIILEIGSYLHVVAIPVVEDIIIQTDWWVHLANFMFFMAIFTFAFALVLILRQRVPE